MNLLIFEFEVFDISNDKTTNFLKKLWNSNLYPFKVIYSHFFDDSFLH